MKVKHYSSASIAVYSEHLPGLFAYLKEQGITDVKRVSRDHLQGLPAEDHEHTSARTKSKYSIGTICTKTRAMKRFFKYLEDAGMILINPAEHIKEPKKETRLPKAILSEDEVRKILEQPRLGTINGVRARALLEVLYSTGIRLEELMNLTIFDCDLQGGLIRVKGKFSKDRVVPLGKHAVQFLKEYITRVRPPDRKEQGRKKPLRQPLRQALVETGDRAHGARLREESRD